MDSKLRYPTVVNSLLELDEILAMEPECAKAVKEFNEILAAAKNALLFDDETLRKLYVKAEQLRCYSKSGTHEKEVKTGSKTGKSESDCTSSPDKPS